MPAAEVYRLCESNPPTVVYLHGRASVIEVGVLHDVADLRNCHAPSELDDDDRVFQSTEVVVRDLPRDKWSLHTHVTHFVVSCTDPGGVIRLRDGRVVGFVKGKALAGAPVAYISLAEPLLQRIAETTGAREASFVPCWRDDAKIRREFEEMEERYKAKRGTEMDGIKTADLKFSL